jgi:hypothetical protein
MLGHFSDDSDSDSQYDFKSPDVNIKEKYTKSNILRTIPGADDPIDESKICIDTLARDSYCNYTGIRKEAYDKFKSDMPIDGSKDITIVLNTTSGSVFYAMLIMKIIMTRTGKTVALIPEMATCAGTMIALACDEIHMTSHACLGHISQWSSMKIGHLILPALDNWREKNFVADVGYHYYQNEVDADTKAILKLFSLKYSKEEIALIEEQFMSVQSSSLPIFACDLDHLPIKIVIDETIQLPKKKQEQPGNSAGYMNSLLRLVGM